MDSMEQQLTAAGLSWKIWREGDTANNGELRTYRGTLWIAQQDGVQSKPGTSTQWKMAVKAGSLSAEAHGEPGAEKHSAEPTTATPTKCPCGCNDMDSQELFLRDVAVRMLDGTPLAIAWQQTEDARKRNGKVGGVWPGVAFEDIYARAQRAVQTAHEQPKPPQPKPAPEFKPEPVDIPAHLRAHLVSGY